ncbi:MAG: endonuclease/exonuclease/phosphatase family protein [Myxococcota bacterium]
MTRALPILRLLAALLLLAGAACESGPGPAQPGFDAVVPAGDADADAGSGAGEVDASHREEPDAETDEGDATPDEVVEPLPEAEVTIATWNVHRFFDTECDTGDCGDGEYEAWPYPDEFQARVDSMAAAIQALEADVLLLQEVETQASLDALVEALGDGWPTAVLGETGYPGSVDVAVIARAPLVKVETHRGRAIPLPGDGHRVTHFSRELLEVHVEVGGRRVVVFDAHFKSKNDDDPARRLAEAQAARERVLAVAEARPRALVLLGGDLNDTPGSPPLEALEEGGDLERVAAELPEGDDATYAFGGSIEAIDHLYLVEDAAGVYVDGTVEVHGGPWSGYGDSDHAALSARFRLPAVR